ncbi:unnamed protein product [Lepeophtheirus salmonis]|uniref:(salmon louse) hypothetical protein n=1 Tax=Lepeophtheirus salmonis TaxID=72036 RepID=A0A7R8CKX5_LEPSM|nr:unnamed protein product [Lepeophtheirus salmonis]CAF2849813.1 unnamed protein product [Lepeophtheirus salmonis]
MKTIHAIFDTGASVSCLLSSSLPKLTNEKIKDKQTTPSGSNMEQIGKNLASEIILGIDFQNANDVWINGTSIYIEEIQREEEKNQRILEERDGLHLTNQYKMPLYRICYYQSGFHQQNLEPKSRQYTAFTMSALGQFQFQVSCFGSHGAPSESSALTDTIFSRQPRIITYMDDILCSNKNHKIYCHDLETTIKVLRRKKLKLNP